VATLFGFIKRNHSFHYASKQEAVMAGEDKEQKIYIKPEVVEELDLETRAGSPTSDGQPDPLDLP
jgi:hypothetical protein